MLSCRTQLSRTNSASALTPPTLRRFLSSSAATATMVLPSVSVCVCVCAYVCVFARVRLCPWRAALSITSVRDSALCLISS
jgi:hypothetical protein